jgi:hypothetical protein
VYSPVTVWYALTRERFFGPFFFDERIITSNSFLDMLENYAPLRLNNNFILRLLILLALPADV